MISQTKLKKHLHYDPVSGLFNRLISPKGGCNTNNAAGTVKTSGCTKYLMISVDGLRRPAQQFAWVYMTGSVPSGVIDHIDGDGINNKWANLRDVTLSENSRNQRLRKSNTSGFMGVTWRCDNKKWRVRINSGGKRIQIGEFKNLSDAVLARLNAEEECEYHKSHGRA